MTYFVRTRSRGARTNPVLTAAATATPRDAHGYGESARVAEMFNPASGTLKRAENRPRDHCSMVCRRRAWMNVALEAFHTPQDPSLDHSCDMTSSNESTFFSDNWWVAVDGLFGEGEGSLVLGRRLLWEGEWMEPEEGAVDVKYAGSSSGSESSEGYYILLVVVCKKSA